MSKVDDRSRLWDLETWRTLVSHHTIRAQRTVARLTVEADGETWHQRCYHGLEPAYPVSRLTFREHAVGVEPLVSDIEVQTRDVAYRVSCKSVGEWNRYVIRFPEKWTGGTIDLTLKTLLPDGCVEKMDGGPRGNYSFNVNEGDGSYVFRLVYPTEWLYLSVLFGKTCKLGWWEPAVYAGQGYPDDGESSPVIPISQACASYEWETEERYATLSMSKPLPGYTYTLRWSCTRDVLSAPLRWSP